MGTGGGSGQRRRRGNLDSQCPSDRCPGPSPSGHVGLGRRPSRPQYAPQPHWELAEFSPPCTGLGPSGAGQGGTPPSHSLTPNPLTYHSSLPGCQPLPTRPGGSSVHASPQWPGRSGGQRWPEGDIQMGELWAPKEEGAGRGHLLGSAEPHPLRKPLPPWPVGWDPPGPEGQLRRALSPGMGGPRIFT